MSVALLCFPSRDLCFRSAAIVEPASSRVAWRWDAGGVHRSIWMEATGASVRPPMWETSHACILRYTYKPEHEAIVGTWMGGERGSD